MCWQRRTPADEGQDSDTAFLHPRIGKLGYCGIGSFMLQYVGINGDVEEPAQDAVLLHGNWS
jgi:hypothetical protein